MLRKIVKIIAWLVGGIVTLLVLLYLVLLAVNWRDAQPSATALHFAELYAQRPAVADEDNGFLYAVGMSVEAGLEPITAGVAMVARAREPDGTEPPEHQYNHPDYPQYDFSMMQDKRVAELLEICSKADAKCLAFLEITTTTPLQFSTPDELLFDRYRTLLGFAGWREIYPKGLSGPIFPYVSAIRGQILSLYEVWLHAATRDAAHSLNLLEQDKQFWRRVLSNSDTLVSSMLAIRMLHRNLRWSNLVLRRLANKGGKLPLATEWFLPLTADERTLRRAWTGEWALAEPMLRSAHAEMLKGVAKRDGEVTFGIRLANWLSSPLYQPQDTINRHAEDLDILINSYNVPYEQVARVSIDMREHLSGFGGEGLSFPYLFYNPIGKVLNEIWKPGYEAYLLRAADLEGARRALLATLELRNNKTPPNKIAEALAASSWRNPYTNEPFQWDEATGSVVFEGLGEGSSKRYSFIY